MFVGKNIRFLRTSNDMTLEDISKLLNYKSLSTVQKWEKNIAQPPLKKVQQLADYFHVDIDDFTNTDLQQKRKGDKQCLSFRVPVLGDVAAGIPIEANEEIIDYVELPARYANIGTFFALRIHGDSMSPRICDGDYVVVKQQADADSGDIVIVRVALGTATCKRLRKYADGAIELVSINPSYEPMFYSREQVESEPVEVLGIVVENRQIFKRL